MAGSRVPGPLGSVDTAGTHRSVDRATLARAASAKPGTVGTERADGTTLQLPSTPSEPVLRSGARGVAVAELQRRLNAERTGLPPLTVDGMFGPVTAGAVRDFQVRHSLPADGVVGPATWEPLRRWKDVAPPVPIRRVARPPATVTAAPLPAGKGPQEQKVEKLPACCISALTVRCAHSSRTFRLSLPGAKSGPNGRPLIQLMADGFGSDTMLIALEGGPCARGLPTGKGANALLKGVGDAGAKVPSVSVSGGDLSLVGLPPFKAAVSAPKSDTGIDLVTFLARLFPPDPAAVSTTYGGSLNCCEGGGGFGFDVQVFTAIKWDGRITAGYELGMSSEIVEYSNEATKKDDEPLLVKRARVYNAEDEGKFTLKADVSGEYGGEKFSLASPRFEKKGLASTGPGAAAFPAFKNLFEKMLPQMHRFLSNELVKITVRWPKIEVGGTCTLVESKTEYDVVREGNIYLELSPLLGLEGKTDILDWLILTAASPAVGKLLLEIKTKASKGIGAGPAAARFKAAIELTATGLVGGRFDWKFRPGSSTVGGKVDAKLDLSLEGVCELEIRYIFVSVSGGASVKAKTGVSGELKAKFVDDKPGLGGKLKWAGLTIRAVAYYAVGGSSIGKSEPAGRSILGGKLKGDAAKLKKENELLNVRVLDEWEWPAADGGALSEAL